MRTVGEIVSTIKKVQVYPSKMRVEINDKTVKVVFNRAEKTYQKLVGGKTGELVEVKNHKKHGAVITPYQVQNSEGYDDESPLTEFDRAVLSVCISEWLAGNKYTTVPIIFRALVGKVGNPKAMPRKNQEEAIERSIHKLMFTEFSADIAKSYTTLKYDNGDELQYIESAILPCCRVQAKINGQVIKAIVFDRESPLLSLTSLKNQFVRYDAALLDVPKQNNTPMNISLKNYVVRRVVEIIAHRMMPTITFEDVFKKCRISDASSKTKKDAREVLVELFKHLQNMQIITNFELRYKENGKGFYGISFTFKSKSRRGDSKHFSENIAKV